MKIAKNSKEALELIKKAKERDIIVWDEREKLLLKGNTKELRKKHKQNYRSLSYVQGDFIDKTILQIQLKYGFSKRTVLRDALIYYKMFLEKNFKGYGRCQSNK